MEWIEKRFIVSSKNIHVIWLDFGGKEKKTRVVNVDLCCVLVIIAWSWSSGQGLGNSIAYELYGLLVLH
jgi:hypothetical protein